MKELQVFLENHSLPLAEAFDKCFDIGLTSNISLLAEEQSGLFFLFV